MRSQTAKPLPKKGALGKTSFKTAKQVRKRAIAPKKVKASPKSGIKSPKKVSGDNAATSKVDGDAAAKEKSSSTTEAAKVESSKPNASRENSPSKKCKKESKETKDKAKTSPKKVVSKRPVQLTKKMKPSPKLKNDEKDSDDVKYKINLDAIKKGSVKIPKLKSNPKKANPSQRKKVTPLSKESDQEKQKQLKNDNISNLEQINKDNKNDSKIIVHENPRLPNETKSEKKEENILNEKPDQPKIIESLTKSVPVTNISNNPTEMPKIETERPPKFFTSSRSPRTVDIDVKCCKNSKGNLSVSERFLSMKCETKTDDSSKEKSASNNLISQGPDIDVYTFSEKVDSPKSILSDFRTPVTKNIGRVRPIARVKGTVIDKKSDSERKKFSPHRPIEEVVKQLKANKRSEDLITSQTTGNYVTTGLDFGIFDSEKQMEEKPPIVSKSYKMVARKSSITGQPFSPIKFPDREESPPKEICSPVKTSNVKKTVSKSKKQQKKRSLSDDELNTSTFSLNTKTFHYTSSEESVSESNDDNDNKESSESDKCKNKKTKNKKYKRITDTAKKSTSKELKELSKDSLIDLKDTSALIGNEKPSKRRLKLLSMWSGPKKHRMASLNALAKVHCLYENESRTHLELGLMKTVDRQVIPSTSKVNLSPKKKENKSKDSEKLESTSESEYENKREKEKDSSDSSDDSIPQRTLRGVPGIRSAGKYWDPKSSTSSSEDSELESRTKKSTTEKKKTTPKLSSSSNKSDSDKPPPKMKKTAGVPVKKKRNRNEVVMDLKDMVVQKRMASLNATAILAASYEKRSPKSSKDDTTSDSCSDESYLSQKPKNLISSGVKSESKNDETEKESDDTQMPDKKQKVEVIVNQDTDVTITGVYATHHHEGFCTVSGMQYRISSTSHTQTTATANCEKEGCSRDDGSRYTPLSALSSMQPPEHAQTHSQPVPELGGLGRRAGCSSAFSAPSPAAHHDPGYYQPAGPLIKESGADAERALARYHPPHYHAPHPPVLQQYGPYYPAELCYGRYYRPPGPYHISPPQPDAQMVGVGSEPYPPQYYGTPPCYQHSPQRIPYVEYRGCPCPLNACPKNVLIGPATGKAPTGGGPADVSSTLAPPGGAFRPKVRAGAQDSAADNHGSGKDPPLEPEPPEPPMAADAPHPCPLPAIGGASPKREMYDVRENLRLTADVPGPTEALGPPSPARGACAPQPPPSAPRRARLGKAMARRSLAGDDTALLISTPQSTTINQDADDDVLAISPPLCAPIDLSSSDERSTPLVDVKKENEGPTYASSRKPDAQALKEHNSTTTLIDLLDPTDAAKAVKRRYSKPKLEIEMKDVQLEDACKTNGIGEHVKLQKRRKVSGDHTTVPRIETITKEPKKKSPYKRSQKSLAVDKKACKRKSDTINTEPKIKKVITDKILNEDPRLTNVAAVPNDDLSLKPKNKSALLLDNLIKKNSIDRPDAKTYTSDTKLNPAELFLSPNESPQNCTKKTLNINNNIVDNNVPVNGVQPKTIAAVSQLKKLANKNVCKIEKVDSKITHNLKSVLSSPTEALNVKEVLHTPFINGETNVGKNNLKNSVEDEKPKIIDIKEKSEQKDISSIPVDAIKTIKPSKTKTLPNQLETIPKSIITENVDESQTALSNESNVKHSAKTCEKLDDLNKSLPKRSKVYTDKRNGEFKSKNVENLVKLLTSKKLASKATELSAPVEKKDVEITKTKEIVTPKRCKLTGDKASGESKTKNVEKVVKLLVSKKTAIKTDEASLVVEDACSSPVPSLRKGRRRRSGGRRVRRVAAPLTPPDLQPRVQPKWSNGWNWDGEDYISKVYQNNDTRFDRTARCWPRMTHESGDRVSRGDCVLLRASLKPTNEAQPYVARIASLWEDPENGEMMVSLVWYYRPEHTERGRQAADAPDEVFASRHRDANSVACIEDKCYVLTFNEYCRYKKRLKAAEEGIVIGPSIVPPLPASEVTPALAPNDTKLPPSVSPELVLFCRKIYDFRSKKIHVPNK
ncbi:uncharacterized protein LOC112044019 [Bicyclus anynana]|uniref:Uncharacterized protein LOC112044019 n=1 Tax=Bicyclus anynana TaxID=110368 RepID=A0ABM3LSY5_BICAN|nr:uncharacterized protein LOC112044019 [Bicyclus anynana]XP_052742189.1 uncharacterized protein LOC112044019 [Bicyclus anynana]XP_052742190.1 uncharacterized protein LOC112044019 [Bicyclus anynana]